MYSKSSRCLHKTNACCDLWRICSHADVIIISCDSKRSALKNSHPSSSCHSSFHFRLPFCHSLVNQLQWTQSIRILSESFDASNCAYAKPQTENQVKSHSWTFPNIFNNIFKIWLIFQNTSKVRRIEQTTRCLETHNFVRDSDPFDKSISVSHPFAAFQFTFVRCDLYLRVNYRAVRSNNRHEILGHSETS